MLSLPVKVTRETLQKMPNLRAIQSYSAGADGLDYASVPRDVRVYSNAGGFTRRVAEQACPRPQPGQGSQPAHEEGLSSPPRGQDPPGSDIIVDALPLNMYTQSVLDYDVLKLMKPDSIPVNVGMGETVNEDAVTGILRERLHTRFGTDVFWRNGENEDFETPLWDLENFARTLHSAVLGRDDALAEADVMAAQNPPSSPIA